MSYLTDLYAYRDAVMAKLLALNLDSMNHGVDGRSFSHDGHRESLEAALDRTNKRIIEQSGATEVHTIALG